MAHDPAARERYGVGGPQPGSGPKPLPTEYSLLRERLEGNVERYLSPIERAIDGDDVGLALRAMAELFDRLNGKAKQSAEVAMSGGMTLDALFVRDPLQPTHTPLPEDDA